MSQKEIIMTKIKELAQTSSDFYKYVSDFYRRMREISDEEYGMHIQELINYQNKYSELTCELIKILPKDATLRIYFDIVSGFQDIKYHLENLFITVIYGSKTEIPEPLKVNLDEAIELPLKAFSKIIGALEQYDFKEKLKENIKEISRLEGLMDQSQLTMLRQIESLKGKENDFALLIAYKIAHSIEGIIDVLEDISNYLSR